MPPKKKSGKVPPEPPLQHTPAAEAVLVTLRHRKKDPKNQFRRESALIMNAAQKLSMEWDVTARRPHAAHGTDLGPD